MALVYHIGSAGTPDTCDASPNPWFPDYNIDDAGDTGSALSGWQLSGFNATNTDAFKLYWELVASGGTTTISVYKDVDHLELVAQGSGPTTGGTITLTAQNASGISGSVALAGGKSTDTDSGNILYLTNDVGLADGGGSLNTANKCLRTSRRPMVMSNSQRGRFYRPLVGSVGSNDAIDVIFRFKIDEDWAAYDNTGAEKMDWYTDVFRLACPAVADPVIASNSISLKAFKYYNAGKLSHEMRLRLMNSDASTYKDQKVVDAQPFIVPGAWHTIHWRTTGWTDANGAGIVSQVWIDGIPVTWDNTTTDGFESDPIKASTAPTAIYLGHSYNATNVSVQASMYFDDVLIVSGETEEELPGCYVGEALTKIVALPFGEYEALCYTLTPSKGFILLPDRTIVGTPVEGYDDRILRFKLGRLDPATTYTWSLSLIDIDTSKTYFSQPRTFKTDPGAAADHTSLVFCGLQDADFISYTAVQASKNHDDVGLVILNGDIGDHNSQTDEWRADPDNIRECWLRNEILTKALDERSASVLQPSNHDFWRLGRPGEEFFRVHPSEICQHIQYGRADYYFVSWGDAPTSTNNHTEQLAWLEKALGMSTRQWRIVIFEYTMFGNDDTITYRRSMLERGQLHDLFKRFRVSLVVNGDVAWYNRWEADGVHYVIGPPAVPVDPDPYYNIGDFEQVTTNNDIGDLPTTLKPGPGSIQQVGEHGGYISLDVKENEIDLRYFDRKDGICYDRYHIPHIAGSRVVGRPFRVIPEIPGGEEIPDEDHEEDTPVPVSMLVAHTALTDGVGETEVPLFADATELPKESYDADEVCFYGVNQPNNSGAKPKDVATNEYAAALFAAGIKDSRYEVGWNVVATGAESYNWNGYGQDSDISAIRAQGGTVQIETGYTPMLFNRQRYRTPPALGWVDTPEELTFDENDQIQLGHPGVWRNAFDTAWERRGPFLIPDSATLVPVADEACSFYFVQWDHPENHGTRTAEDGFGLWVASGESYCIRTAHYPIDISTLELWVDEERDGSYVQWTRVNEITDATPGQKVFVADHTGRIAFVDGRNPNGSGHRPTVGSKMKVNYSYYSSVYDGDGVDYSVDVRTGVLTRQSAASGMRVPNMVVDFESGDPDDYFTWTNPENVTESVADGALKLVTGTAAGNRTYKAHQDITGTPGDFSVTLNVSNYSQSADGDVIFGIRLYDSVSGDFILFGGRKGLRGLSARLRNGVINWDRYTYTGAIGTAFRIEVSRTGSTYHCKMFDASDVEIGAESGAPRNINETFNPTEVSIYAYVGNTKALTWWVEDFTFVGPEAEPATEDDVKVLYAYADTAKYQAYGAALATKFGDRCNDFEFGNEIGHQFKWTWNGGLGQDSFALYALCFNAFRAGIRSILPTARVSHAGWADSEIAQMAELYDHLDKSEFDAASWHPYKFLSGTVASWKTNIANTFPAILSAAGDASKAMWAGELSAPCGRLCGSDPGVGLTDKPNERTQAEETIQMLMHLRSLGTNRVSLWPVTDLSQVGSGEANRWGGRDGLFFCAAGQTAIPGGYKPVFYAVRNLAQCKGILVDLGSVQTVGKVTLSIADRAAVDEVSVKGSLTCTDDASKPPKVTAVLVGGTAVAVVTVATGDADLVTEKWTAVCNAGGTFDVSGTVSGSQGEATKNVAFTSTNGVCSLTIPDGTYTEGQTFEWETFAGDGFTEIGVHHGGSIGAGDIIVDCGDASARYLLIELTRAPESFWIRLKQIAVQDDEDAEITPAGYVIEGWQEGYLPT